MARRVFLISASSFSRQKIIQRETTGQMENKNHMSDDGEFSEEEGGDHVDGIYIPPLPKPTCSFDTTGPRLVISHIENINFKSYAGKKVLGPLHKNFTSIIGPNGSGKSNVIDSMLFVFGYKSKKLRSSKVSAMIHSSENHPNKTYCKVTVFFKKIVDKENEEFEVLPDFNLSISRKAFKDNTSRYKVNGKGATFKDVRQALNNEGIDLDKSRFLILQGEVEQIALMKPKAETEHETGMLEFLEEIIGTHRYVTPIAKLEERVEELNVTRQEQLTSVKNVEREKEKLKEPLEKALEYMHQENKAVVCKHKVAQVNIVTAKEQEKEAEAAKCEIEANFSGMISELEQVSNDKKEKQTLLSQLNKAAKTVNAEKEKKVNEFTDLDIKDSGMREEYKHLDTRLAKHRKQIEQDKQKIEANKRKPAENARVIEELNDHLVTLEKNRQEASEAVEEAMKTLAEETKDLQKERQKYENECLAMQASLNEAKTEMDMKKSELDVYKSSHQNEKQLYDKMKKAYEESQQIINQRTSQVKELESKIPAYEKELKKKEMELEEVRKDKERCDAEESKLSSTLHETRSSFQNSTSKNAVLKSLMKQKQLGVFPGLYGRLGDLGSIDDKYDVAISTACGQLDSFVVDSSATAEKCLEFLKKGKIGVASFILLEQMEKWKPYCYRKISTPANSERLYDLVSVKDEKMLPAFYFALRDTLVTKDLEEATRIAQGQVRHRVITLDGVLFEKSGTFCGGGNKQKQGGMKSTIQISAEEVTELEEKHKVLKQKQEELAEKKQLLEDKVTILKKDLREAAVNLKKFSMDLKSHKSSVDKAAEELKAQADKVQKSMYDEGEAKKMEAELQRCTKDYEKEKAKNDKVEAEVKRVSAKITDVTDKKMKGVLKKREELVTKIKKTKAEINKLNVEVKTAEREVVKLTQHVEKLEQEIREGQEKFETLKEQLAQNEVIAGTLLEEKKKLEAEDKKMQQELNQVKKHIDEVVSRENQLKSGKVDFDDQMQKQTAVIKEVQRQIKHWEKEMSKLKLEAIPRGLSPDNEPESEESELLIFSPEELLEMNVEALKSEIADIEEYLKKQDVNLNVIQEYRRKEEIYIERSLKLNEITDRRNQVKKARQELQHRRITEFSEGKAVITEKLKELYQMITNGGLAELDYVDTSDPFSEGIVFSVMPPKKAWKPICNLSGGEKTLSSLALVFALHFYKTTPFYVMDEIDAALDYRNVGIIGRHIKEQTKNAQFLIISLRPQMFEKANRLIGIYKTNNVTNFVVIEPDKVEQLAKSEEVDGTRGI